MSISLSRRDLLKIAISTAAQASAGSAQAMHNDVDAQANNHRYDSGKLTTHQLHLSGAGVDGDVATTYGLYSAGDSGGGNWVWDSSAQKSDANLGTAIDPDKPLSLDRHRTAVNDATATGETSITLSAGIPAKFSTSGKIIINGDVHYYTGYSGNEVTIAPPGLQGEYTNEYVIVCTGQGSASVGKGCWVRTYTGFLNVHWFGAQGDNSNDDSNAINAALETMADVELSPNKKYLLMQPIMMYNSAGFDGKGATLRFDFTNLVGNSFGPSVPDYTAIYIEPRPMVINSERNSENTQVGNVKVRAFNTSGNSIGFYMGSPDLWKMKNQPSSVNNSVYGYLFDDISLRDFHIGLLLSELWNVEFRNIHSHFVGSKVGSACHIEGQVINASFVSCRFHDGKYALKVDGRFYYDPKAPSQVEGSPTLMRRPEGISFTGSFIGQGKTAAVYGKRALAAYFSNCIIDLNRSFGMRLSDASRWAFTNCYIAVNTGATIQFDELAVESGGGSTAFFGCTILNHAGEPRIVINNNHTAIVVQSCVFYASNKSGIINLNGSNIGLTLTSNNFKKIINEGSNILVNADGNAISQLQHNIYDDANFTLVSNHKPYRETTEYINMQGVSSRNGKFVYPDEVNDANAVSGSCFFKMMEDTANGLGAIAACTQIDYDGSFIVQIGYLTNGTRWERLKAAGTWGAWRQAV